MEPSPFIKNATPIFYGTITGTNFNSVFVEFFHLTEYCRSVTIVTKTKTTFFTRKIDQFHPKTGQFRHFFEVKNVVNFSNSSRQYSVKDIILV